MASGNRYVSRWSGPQVDKTYDLLQNIARASTSSIYDHLITVTAEGLFTVTPYKKGDVILGASSWASATSGNFVTKNASGELTGTIYNQNSFASATEFTNTIAGIKDGATIDSFSDVETELAKKQPNLVSGTNIKTVNNTNLLGGGNVSVQPVLVSGTNIRTINGNTLLGSSNIEVQSVIPAGSAGIASVSSDVVVLKAGLIQNNGAISNSTDSDITLGTAARKTAVTSLNLNPSDNNILTELATATELNKKVNGLASGTTEDHVMLFGSNGYTIKDSGKAFSTTTPSSTSTDAEVPTSKAVYTAINSLPTPMQFKGTVGDAGDSPTVTWANLPSASVSDGYTYKVISNHSTAPICKAGDTIISNGASWVVIPSGDEPSGTVTSVNVQSTSGSHISVSGETITSSGTFTIGLESGYSIPATVNQLAWNGKQNAITDGSATIATVSNDIVTLKAAVGQSSGAVTQGSGNDITLAKVAKTGAYADLSGRITALNKQAITLNFYTDDSQYETYTLLLNTTDLTFAS